MIQRRVLSVLVLAMSGCKAQTAALEAADARGGRFDRIEDGSYLLCDCGALLPFADRPALPWAHPIAGGARCAFNAAGAQAATTTSSASRVWKRRISFCRSKSRRIAARRR